MTMKTRATLKTLKFVLIGVLAVFMVLILYCDYQEQKQVRLDRLRDQLAFTDLLNLESGDSPIEARQLERYLTYFESLIKKDLASPEAYALAGFCYFHMGDINKALAAYQKAVELKPGIFWFHYNLGVIYHLLGQDQNAFTEFRKALSTQPQDNTEFLRHSKIFVYIIYKADLKSPFLGERLKQGYALSAYFVVLSLEKAGDREQATKFRQQMLSSGIEFPKGEIKPQLRVF